MRSLAATTNPTAGGPRIEELLSERSISAGMQSRLVSEMYLHIDLSPARGVRGRQCMPIINTLYETDPSKMAAGVLLRGGRLIPVLSWRRLSKSYMYI